MLVNAKIIENLSKDAGEERTKRAKNYKNLGRVKITNTEYENSQNFTIQATVIGSEIYKTYVAIRNGAVKTLVLVFLYQMVEFGCYFLDGKLIRIENLSP